MSENKTCKNCKYWGAAPDASKGVCHLSKQKMFIMSSPCGLYTASNFGCNQFQEKKEGDNESKKLVYVR